MASEIKSIRVDESLVAKLGKESRFTDLVTQAIKEFVSKSVWVPNFQIERYAGISSAILLNRTRKIEYLRYSDSAVKFTLYPVSDDAWMWNRNIHAYANGDYNSIHDGFVYFNLHFPVDFLLFLKTRTWEQVEANIHGFLAFLYWIDKDRRSIMESQLEKKTLKKVIKMVKSERFAHLEGQSKKMMKDPKLRADYCDSYLRLMTDLGIDAIIFPYIKVILSQLHYPIHFSDALRNESYLNIKIPAAYMRDIYDDTDDWQSIVVRGVDRNDKLLRAESNAEPWKIWLQEYSFYHYREVNDTPKKRRKDV